MSISITLENDVVTDPPFMRPEIRYETHQDTMKEMGQFFPGVTSDQIAGAEGFGAAERVKLTTHNGTDWA